MKVDEDGSRCFIYTYVYTSYIQKKKAPNVVVRFTKCNQDIQLLLYLSYSIIPSSNYLYTPFFLLIPDYLG